MRRKRGWTDDELLAGKLSPRTASLVAPTPTSAAGPSTLIPPVVEDDKTARTFFLPKPDLKSVWEKGMNRAFPGEWHELTPWVKKQLNEFGSRCGSGYLLPHAECLLGHTIKNWLRFTEKAKQHYGWIGDEPKRPTMKFLLKYLGAAVNLYLFDHNLEFIGCHVQPKAPLPSNPSQNRPLDSRPTTSREPTASREPECEDEDEGGLSFKDFWDEPDEPVLEVREVLTDEIGLDAT